MVEQGVNPRGFFVRRDSFRVLFFLYVLCAFVATASFKGNLLASLVKIDLEPRIDSSKVKYFDHLRDFS